MSNLNIRDPHYSSADGRLIDATVDIPGVGNDLPYTFSATDVSGLGQEYYPRLVAGEFGPIAPYEPPAEGE